MHTKTARLYDAIYSFKDYAAESAMVTDVIERLSTSRGKSLLDVACGTGAHMKWLREFGFTVEGLDLDQGLLDVARDRCPNAPLHFADMIDFDLGKRFDAVICLFSSIGYAKTVSRLSQAVATMARHLKQGGVLLVEPWFAPDVFKPGRITMLTVDEPNLKLCRMNTSRIDPGEENPITPIEFYYQVMIPHGVERFEERHELGLFTREQYQSAFDLAGLRTSFDEHGIDGRGMWIGIGA